MKNQKTILFSITTFCLLFLSACGGGNLLEDAQEGPKVDLSLSAVSHLEGGLAGSKEVLIGLNGSEYRFVLDKLLLSLKELELIPCLSSEVVDSTLINLDLSIDLASQEDLQEFTLLLEPVSIPAVEYCSWTMRLNSLADQSAIALQGEYFVNASEVGTDFNWQEDSPFEVTANFQVKDDSGQRINHSFGHHAEAGSLSLMFGFNYEMLLQGVDPEASESVVLNQLIQNIINGVFHQHLSDVHY